MKKGLVDGVWIQDHTVTLETAKHVTNDTEIANSYRIKVAVAGDLRYSNPDHFSLCMYLFGRLFLSIRENLVEDGDNYELQ